jgi:hypothetical protein
VDYCHAVDSAKDRGAIDATLGALIGLVTAIVTVYGGLVAADKVKPFWSDDGAKRR